MTVQRGFTLIEVLVVLAIISILATMGFSLLGTERRAAEVQAEAERLAAVLRLTRNRAMNEQVGYGVAFNIRNGVGTSGAVLNNWDGGHYYRIIGPHRTYRELPVVPSGYDHNLPRYLDEVRDCWVSEPYTLPQRRVRFLALSDLDRGPQSHKDDRYYETDDTYPRPWFGVYDQPSGRWLPWGGYEPGTLYSGFYFEGKDGIITGSVNPTDRMYNEDFNRDKSYADHDDNGDGDTDDPFEREVNYPIWRAGEGRDLVNANWLDACIFFMPSGEAIFLEWNHARRAYEAAQATDLKPGFNGINDRCVLKQSGQGWNGKNGSVSHLFNTHSTAHARNDKHPQSQHFLVHTGGWRITLAPDAAIDDNRFDSVDDAIATFHPAWRVEVLATGAVRVFRVQRRHSGSFLDERPTWPDAPGDWQSKSLMKKFHSVGWLHEEDELTERGTPIIDKVTGRMLTERIWWFED